MIWTKGIESQPELIDESFFFFGEFWLLQPLAVYNLMKYCFKLILVIVNGVLFKFNVVSLYSVLFKDTMAFSIWVSRVV